MDSFQTTYKHPQKHYARLYGRSTRSIRDYMAIDAPLDDEAAMQQWLQRKKSGNIPRVRLPVADLAEVSATSQGAAEALRRLEAAEAAASVVFGKAQASGDTAQIEAARKAWLQTCRELRYLDQSVNLDRRDGLEMIPKQEAINALKEVSFQISAILYDVIEHVLSGNDPKRHLVRQLTLERFQVSLFRFSQRWPKWAVEVIKASIGAEYVDAEDLDRAYDLVFGLESEHAPDMAKQEAEDQRRRDAYNDLQYMDAKAPRWRHYAYDENKKIKEGYGWAKDREGFSYLVWRGPGECPEGLQPGEAIINGKVVMVDPTIAQAS
jgi:hypothetical protein